MPNLFNLQDRATSLPIQLRRELSSEENIVEASPDEISDDSDDQIDSGNQEPQAS